MKLFYMLQGDMRLVVMRSNGPEEIVIREGEAYLVPGRVPHSPQRSANTIGLVIERQRLITELDSIRFYATENGQLDGPPSPHRVLIDKWFHCSSLGPQLTELLKELQTCHQIYYDRGCRDDSSISPLRDKPPFEPNLGMLPLKPISIHEWLTDNRARIQNRSPLSLFDSSLTQSSVKVYGQGSHDLQTAQNSDLFLWQWAGSSVIVEIFEDGQEESNFPAGNCALVAGDTSFRLINPQLESVTVIVGMPFPLLT